MDYYKILEVPRNATLKEIKKAYKSLALINHPDKNPNDVEKLEKFKIINEAFTILSDENKRRQYDIYGITKKSNIQTSNKIINIEMELLDLYNNIDKKIKFERKLYCDECTLKIGECKLCKGAGYSKIYLNYDLFKIPQMIKCKCQNGKEVSGTCIKCNNKGYKIKNEEINLKYYTDNFLFYQNNINIIISNLGDFGEDLTIQIIDIKHPIFKRSYDNLIMDLEISVEESLRLRKKIILIDNKEIYIKNDNFIRHGDIYIVKDYGLKNGNLFINFLINFNNIKIDKEKIINYLNEIKNNNSFIEIQYFKNKIDVLNIQDDKTEFVNECNNQ